jgi:hypothetical protein
MEKRFIGDLTVRYRKKKMNSLKKKLINLKKQKKKNDRISILLLIFLLF